MTILPTKRTANNVEENKDNNQQNNNNERSVRRREEISSMQISSLSESSTTSRRSPYGFGANASERKERLRKRYKEAERPRDREREREQKREVRREQKRDRIAKRDSAPEPLHDAAAVAPEVDTEPPEPVGNNNEAASAIIKDDCTGFNSEDEYEDQRLWKNRNLTDEEWQKVGGPRIGITDPDRDDYFSRCMSKLGFEINQINEDGACLFRSIADQVYGDQEFHYQVRQDCLNYIVKNRDYFEPYVIEDFDNYVARKRKWNVHGNHLEIQAMSELYNRTIEVYCYQIEPINIFNGSRILNTYEPIRLSYHRMCHYNSISNPNKPSVGVGLGLPNYHPTDIDRRKFNDAVRASEQLLIEQTMLEDKLLATDWEATNEAIEEQVARESYIQYFRDAEKRLKAQGNSLGSTSSSTITSAMLNSPRSSRRGSVSPKACQSPPKGSTSPKNPFPSLGNSASTAIPSPVSFGTEPATDSGPPAYVPTEEELAFAKRVHNSPRRVEQPDTFKTEDYPETFGPQFQNTLTEEAGPSNINENGLGGFEDFDQGIMAQVLAESQKTYLEELKHKSRKRNTSPGPSTSS